MSDVRGRRVTVMGLGRFGGGIGAVRYLLDHGARVTVTDLRDADELDSSIRKIHRHDEVRWHLGHHRNEDFSGAELIVTSPAVPPSDPYLALAREHGVPVTTEICLFWQASAGRIIGVTGSVGKSTTSSLIHTIIESAGLPCRLGGNIGGSLLTDVQDIRPNDYVVLELSSFQLHYLNRIQAAPAISVVTCFSANHLDWHGSLDEYRTAKQAITRWQPARGCAVMNAGEPGLQDWPGRARRFGFGNADCGEDGVYLADGTLVFRDRAQEDAIRFPGLPQLPGRHNERNIAAAAAAAWRAGVRPETVVSGIHKARALPHRLQLVAEFNARQFYNDSKATTPQSVIAALHAFDKPIVLLAGGSRKGVSLDQLADVITERARHAVLMGETSGELGAMLHARRFSHSLTVSFDQACQTAWQASEPGDIVLLSPGCASYDWFRDFEQRGERFEQFVHQLKSANDR